MACRGVLFAITEEQAQRLRAARGDDAAVLHIVQDEIEQAWDEAHLCQTDKAWDAIYRCLDKGEARSAWFRSFGSRLRRSLTMTGGSAPNDAARDPSKDALGLCILGGEQLHKGGDYIVSLLTPEQVKQVAEALRPIDKEWMRVRYFKIDPQAYWHPMV